MLVNLFLQNFALVDSANIDFYDKLNVLTGETGAGKSILIDAMSLCLGSRASTSYIRSGTNKCRVAATFEVDNNSNIVDLLCNFGLDFNDGTLIITREITANGRNKCFINGQPVTVQMLKQISKYLINIYGQHEHTLLLQETYQRNIIDAWGGDKIEAVLSHIAKILSERDIVLQRLNNLGMSDSIIARELDILNFQYQEIDNAALSINEEEDLERESNYLRNIEVIHKTLSDIESLFQNSQNSFFDMIGAYHQAINKIVQYDDNLETIQTTVDSIYYNLEELAHETSKYLAGMDFDINRLNQVEERLDLINSLKRKYGNTIEEILQFSQNVLERIELLENSSEKRAELTSKLKGLEEKYIEKTQELSRLRQHYGRDLCNKLQTSLTDLGMKYAKLSCEVIYNRNTFSLSGSDTVQFLFSANKGEPLSKLQDVISGGELSRLMLCLKALTTNHTDVTTMIFDEIDTGIGGQVAKAVANKLSTLSKNKQVLCVTHLPVIAAKGDYHFRIQKEIKNNRTITSIKQLNQEERINELMRMMGANKEDNITKEHVKKLFF